MNMPDEKKLVIFDIDGTIVSYNGNTHIPEETKEAVRRLRENGHTVAFATSRDCTAASPVMTALDLSAAVLNNGAMVISGGTVIFEKRISRKISAQIRESLLHTAFVVFAHDGRYVYEHNASEESKHYISAQTSRCDIIRPLSVCKSALLSLNVYGVTHGTPVFPEFPEGVLYEENLHEIRADGTSKSDGVIRLADFFGVKMSNVVAVGDGYNDIGMIKAAGTGAAVGGACAEVKEAADIVFDDIDCGGIKKGFENLNLI